MSEIDPAKLQGDMVPQGEFRSASQLKELHENTDLDIRGVLLYMSILTVIFLGCFFVLAAVMNRFKAEETEKDRLALSNRFKADPTPPGPVLQDNPAAETRAILETSRVRLESYGWNDEAKTSAHIPVDRAMAILVERGLPDVGKVDQFHPAPGSSGLPMIGVPGRPAAAPAPEATAAPKTEAPPSEVKP